MATGPTAIGVTSPLPSTVARAGTLLAQVTTRPLSGPPAVSFGVAVSCNVAPTRTLAIAGLTVTDATGTLVTVTVAVPDLPSLVAVIVADPAATPVTNPLALTVATAGALLDQVTTRPLSVAPAASLVTAESCSVAPTSRPAGAGLTVTLATGTLLTVMADVPLIPSLVAVIVAEPAAIPVTNPLALTVATAALLLPHVTTRPARATPFTSFGVAVSCCVAPTSRLAAAGLTVTLATGTFSTVMADVPLIPSLVAVIVAEPAAMPVTNPLALTVATAVLLLPHVTTRPARATPFTSFGVAVSCCVAPTSRLAAAGLTVTLATGTFSTVMADVPLIPSLVAVLVAEPAAMPVTNPLALTVATAVLLLPHVTTRPARATPFTSFGVAVSCTVPPAVTVPVAGLTVREATGTLLIVIGAVPASKPPVGY